MTSAEFIKNIKGSKREGKGYEIACAQLCGNGHSVMVNPFIVHNNTDDYLEWLRTEAGSVETDDWGW